MKRFLGFAALAMLFVGCTKDIDTDINIQENGIVRGELVEMTLVIEDTRVARDDAGKLAWNEGDQVAAVLLNDGKYTLDPEKYTINAEEGTAVVPANTAYMIYPATLATEVSEAGIANLDFTQSYTLANPAEIFDHNPMKGIVSGKYVSFKNMVGYVEVPLTGTGSLNSVTLKSEIFNGFKPLSKAATLDLSNKSSLVAMADNNTARAWVKVAFSTPVDLATSPVVYLPVPANTYANMALVVETDKGATSIYAENSHTISLSKVKPVSAAAINVTSHTPATPKMLSGESGDPKMDFANTYIVPPTAGEYAFKATLCDGCELKGGVTAEIVWAEEAGMFYDFHYNPETNVISFKSNGKEGNALVALSKHDFSGRTIVWSWLLWCTDAPEDIHITGGDDPQNTYVVTDRVMGATWHPTTVFEDERASRNWSTTDMPYMMNGSVSAQDANDGCGVYYQYQNMIPYPRIKNLDAAVNETKDDRSNTRIGVQYGFHQYCQYWTHSTACGEVEVDDNGQFRTAASYNLSYMYYSGNNAWCYTPLPSHAGSVASFVQDHEGEYCLWGGSSAVKTDLAVKTSHDPCPAGYIVENTSGFYHYQSSGAANSNVVCGYVRNPEDSDVHSATTGYKFYGMYRTGVKNAAGDARVLYTPTCSNRNQTLCKTIGSYSNMGYLYQYNTNTNGTLQFTYTYDGTDYFGYYASNHQFGGSGNSGTSIGAPGSGWNTKKITNAQAYPIRCRKKGN